MKLLVTPAGGSVSEPYVYCIMRNRLFELVYDLQCALARAALSSNTVVALMVTSLRYTVQIPS